MSNESLRRVKPRFLLDVDGILADFVGPFLEIINRLGGTSFVREDVTSWDICVVLKLSDDLGQAAYSEARKPGFCLSLPAFDLKKSQVAVRRLEERYELYYVTSPMGGDYWMAERAKWLEKHFSARPCRVVQVGDKHIIGGRHLLDDKHDNLVKWSENKPRRIPILWDTPHNRFDPDNFPRARSWDELFELLDGHP